MFHLYLQQSMALPYPLHHLVSLTTKHTEKKALCIHNKLSNTISS